MMRGMFDMAWNYSQDLSMWCVPLIESEPDNFWRDTELTADKLPNWGASCPVSQVVLSAPADGATDQALTPSLSWQADAEATGYRLEVSTDDFATALHSYEGAATSHTLDSLAHETTYSWRVRATNEAGDGQWSESWSFTTQAAPITPVSQVVLSTPADGATDQALTPSLSWQADVEASGYRLEVSTDDFATALHSYEGAATSHTLDSLAYETTYSWRVRATNDAGDGQWSESWGFTTQAAPITPVSQVVLSAPADGATDQALTPSLSWQPTSRRQVTVLRSPPTTLPRLCTPTKGRPRASPSTASPMKPPTAGV
jgi:Fibronectin type III domain.